MPTTATGDQPRARRGVPRRPGRPRRPATVAKHYRSLQQLFRWLVEDGEIPRSPMERMSPPAGARAARADAHRRRAARAARRLPGNRFENRRDTAILRLFIDTGMRAGELVGLTVDDVDFEQDVRTCMGKGAAAGPSRSAPRPPTRSALPAGAGAAPARPRRRAVARQEGPR